MMGLVPIVTYLKSNYYDPSFTEPKKIEEKRKQDEMDSKALQMLKTNEFGVPTRPTYNMEHFTTFICSPAAMGKTFDFFAHGLDLNSDQLAGLDSYSTENDERMMELIAESKKKQGGH